MLPSRQCETQRILLGRQGEWLFSWKRSPSGNCPFSFLSFLPPDLRAYSGRLWRNTAGRGTEAARELRRHPWSKCTPTFRRHKSKPLSLQLWCEISAGHETDTNQFKLGRIMSLRWKSDPKPFCSMQGAARRAKDFPSSVGIVFAVDHTIGLPRVCPAMLIWFLGPILCDHPSKLAKDVENASSSQSQSRRTGAPEQSMKLLQLPSRGGGWCVCWGGGVSMPHSSWFCRNAPFSFYTMSRLLAQFDFSNRHSYPNDASISWEVSSPQSRWTSPTENPSDHLTNSPPMNKYTFN